MKAIVNTAPRRLELLDLPMPQPGAGMVRIRTHSVGVCATDLQMIAGWQRTGFPAIPGHEWCGVVDAVGAGVSQDLVGLPCVGENILEDGGEVGFEHFGGYAQFFCTLAANLRLLPSPEWLTVAALIEPLAVCLRGLSRLRVSEPGPTLIFGDGPIGLLFLLAMRRKGFESVDLTGKQPNRLALARRLGARQAIRFDDLPALSPAHYPYIIEASGSPAATQQALQHASHGGRILFLGDYAQARASFAWSDLLHREIELVGSTASAGGWPEAVRLAVSGDLPLGQLITHRLPYTRFVEAIELTAHHKDQAVKVFIEWAGA